MLLLAGLGAVISLVVRFRRARGDVRQQIKWFASAAALTLVWILLFGQASLRRLPGIIVALSGLLVIASIPVATGIAILRYRLYDIDRIINRTLVYGSLTATLVALYFGGIVVLQRVFVVLTETASPRATTKAAARTTTSRESTSVREPFIMRGLRSRRCRSHPARASAALDGRLR